MMYTDIKGAKPCERDTEASQVHHHEFMLTEPTSPSESLCSAEYKQKIQHFNHLNARHRQQHKLQILTTMDIHKSCSVPSRSKSIPNKMCIAQSTTPISVFDETECAIIDID
mmetsp:Transcript_7516/g.12298  ORF Transcript_7516/g.12298 Transcript_7516/m.12298 type:complete len:112 (-) Transcript_7516:372-707(-)